MTRATKPKADAPKTTRTAPDASGKTKQRGDGSLIKRARFVAEYLRNGGNGTAAAKKAGFSEKSAHAQATRLLQRAEIKAQINAGLAEIEASGIMGATEVLKALSLIGRADIRKVYGDKGQLLEPHAMPDEIALALNMVESEDLFDGAGGDREHVGYTRKVKLIDKLGALRMLGQHHGILGAETSVDLHVNLAERMSKARQAKRAEK